MAMRLNSLSLPKKFAGGWFIEPQAQLVQRLAGTNLFPLAFLMLIFDIPRYGAARAFQLNEFRPRPVYLRRESRVS